MLNNKLNNIGDILLVNVNAQISGKVQLAQITSNIVGLTSKRTVKTEIRTTADGVFWSEWVEIPYTGYVILEEPPMDADGAFYIQIRYERTGSDTEGVLEFVDVNFTGAVEPNIFVSPTIEKSIFAETINEPELKVLENNIFKKLYYRGILPQYIIRAENSDLSEDKDFVDLWSSVAKFFGLFIRFFKRYENFNNDYSLLYEYVKQNGLYFDETKVTLEDLQYLTQHFYDQIRQRGTNMIFKRKGEVLPDGTVVPIDGEFIRLMRTRIYDELLYEVIPLDEMGWCVGKSSPLWRGTSRSKNLNKTPEDTSDFQNLNNFFISKSPNSNYYLQTYDNKKVLLLTSSNNGYVGLGRINDSQDASDKLTVVDSKMDYEITFAFNIIEGIDKNVELRFGVEGFDNSKNKLNDAFITPDGSAVSELFFDEMTINKIAGTWYYARGIIHSYSTENTNDVKTNLGFGHNLYFNNTFVRYILPKIQLVGKYLSYGRVAIWDYKIRPLVRGTNILPLKNGGVNATSLGFIQSSRIFYIYVKTNNNSLSKQEITEIVNKYLLSYNFNTIFVYISNF